MPDFMGHGLECSRIDGRHEWEGDVCLVLGDGVDNNVGGRSRVHQNVVVELLNISHLRERTYTR
jgi:hypothetical protein